MKQAMRTSIWIASLILAATAGHAGSGPIGTAFTYQGQLKLSGDPVSASADFQFALFDASNAGVQIGSTLAIDDLAIDDGLFTVDLDFGASAFTGDERWLQIAVRSPAGNGSFVTLSPRQPIMPAPYAQFALSAYGPGITNLSASNLTSGEIPASVLTGNYTLTGTFNGAFTGSSATLSRLDPGSITGAFVATGLNSRGVYGAAGSGNLACGVFGEIVEPGSVGTGVLGRAPSYGVTGEATGNGVGVIGRAPTGIGVYGESGIANGTGVLGANTAGSGTTYGVQGVANSPAGYAGHFTGRGYFSGNLGLGTLTPTNRLTVAGSGDFTGQVSVGTPTADARLLVRGVLGEDAFRVRVEGGTKLLVRENGGVGIGSNFGTLPVDGLRVLGNVGIGIDPTDKLHVSGNIRATGSVFASCGTLTCSDLRFKTNIQPITGALELLERLQPVSYDWKRDEFPDRQFSLQRQAGLIAQQVRDVLPEVVQEDGDGYLSVDYGRLTPLLVEAVRELRAEKDAQIASLHIENAQLRSRLATIEQLLGIAER